MKYLGNIAEDDTIVFNFNTHTVGGVPSTLSGTPSLSIYKEDDTSQSSAGITLSVDFDGIVGLNNVKVDTSADAFFEAGKDYTVVIAVGTVDSVSVVGVKVGGFSIEKRLAAIAPSSGSSLITVTLQDTSLADIPDCSFWVSTSESGSPVHAGTIVSNDDGEVQFWGDTGTTYYAFRAKSGMNFSNPQSFVGASSVTVSEGSSATGADEVAICNMALRLCGVSSKIASLSENTTEAEQCNEEYTPTLKQVLEDHHWQFAAKFSSLTADVDTPAWYWTVQYTMPTDLLNIQNLESENIPYEIIEGGKIVTNQSSPMKIKYTAYVTDTTKFPMAFKKALACKIAANICIALTKDLKRADWLERKYDRLVADARFYEQTKRSYQPLDSSWGDDARRVGPSAVDLEGDLNA